jgi:hypothetical protein
LLSFAADAGLGFEEMLRAVILCGRGFQSSCRRSRLIVATGYTSAMFEELRRRLLPVTSFFVFVVCIVLGCATNAREPWSPHRVEGSTIISTGSPTLRMAVDPALKYIGRFSFTIGDIAGGERLIFAETKEKVVHRMLIVQFESILPQSEEVYRYDISDGIALGGRKYRHSVFAFSSSEAAKENPKNEAALTAKFFNERGYEVADDLIASRFATHGGERERDEMIIFYQKPLSSTGHRMSELFGPEETPTELGRQVSAQLTEESLKAFQIEA